MNAVHHRVHHKVRFVALVICTWLLAAFIGCLIDIDHPLFFMGIVSSGRAFHPLLIPLGVISLILGLGLVISLLRRFHK